MGVHHGIHTKFRKRSPGKKTSTMEFWERESKARQYSNLDLFLSKTFSVNICNFYVRVLFKRSDTLRHQPIAWPVPNACAQPYHPGSGSHEHW